jgi:hypothetical protein
MTGQSGGIVISSPQTLNVQTVALSDSPSILVVCHEPDMAFDPAGPFSFRFASPLPVTGGPPLVLLLSVNVNIMVLPSEETVEAELPTTVPSFLSVSSIEWSFTTLIAMVL